MAIRIYRDVASDHCVFNPSDVDPKPTNSLHAYATDDGRIDILATYTAVRLEVANLAYTDVLNEAGEQAALTLFDTVNYLNSQFDASGVPTGNPPAITSPLAVEVVEGTSFRYSILATESPYLYLASGLPGGLSCHPTTGVISGNTSVVGAHNVLVTAINAYGSATETLVLTVSVAGGYHNTHSILFRDHIYYHHLAIDTTAALNHGSGESWSVGVWLYLSTLRESDLFSQGRSTNYRHIYINPTGQVVLTFLKSGGARTYRTNTSLSAGVWVHVVVAYSSAPSCIVYFNGVAQAMTLVANTLASNTSNTQDMRLGRRWGGLLDSVWLDGYLDEWAYWNKTLSAPEAAAVYNGGVPHDLTLLDTVANLKQWLLMGDGDSYPNLTDNAAGNLHDASMVNMTALNIVSFTP
jgi:hypothetical protein